MRVTKSTLDRYRKEVDDQAELAREYVSRSLDEYFRQNPDASTADGRRFAIALLEAALPNFTDAAGTLAVDFFDEMMEAEGIEVDSRLYDTTDYSIIDDKVRYFAGKLNNHDEAAFKKQVVDATHYFVKRSAYDNMVKNCDANNVRYARVPSGFETCAFCFMLASRGFVYLSEAKARGEHAYHDNCDCCIVPGKKGRTVIEGYDSETMYRNWLNCEKAIGGRERAREEWLALSDVERDDYIARHGTDAKAFARFEQNRILREAETRDWHWLYTGELPKKDYSWVSRDSFGRLKNEPDWKSKPNPVNYDPNNFQTKNSNGDWKDLFAHDVLRWNGYGITPRPKDFPDKNGITQQNASSPDLSLQRDVWGRGYLWEIKSPELPSKPPKPGKELYFIGNAFKDARERNFNKPFDPETNNPVDDWDGKLRVVLNLRYRSVSKTQDEIISTIKSQMDYWEISEVLYIDIDGNLSHLKG